MPGTRPGMTKGEPPMISLADLQRRIEKGELSPDAALAQSLAAIDAQEKTIGAFVHRAQIRARAGSGPLRGIAVGIKDIIDTADMPTEMGAAIYAATPARGCAGGDAPEAGGRDHRRQDHDHGVRRARSDRDAQSAQSRPYAGRLVVGLGGGGRRPA